MTVLLSPETIIERAMHGAIDGDEAAAIVHTVRDWIRRLAAAEQRVDDLEHALATSQGSAS